MTPKDLYEWAVKHDVQDCDIEIQYRDGGGCYCGTADARLDEIEIKTECYGKVIYCNRIQFS